MIIVFGRPVPAEGMYVSPVFRHINGMAHWRDMLSHDTSLIMSVIDDQLPTDVISAISGDPDVFKVSDTDPESVNSGGHNPDRKISAGGFANIQDGARMIGVPDSILDANMTRREVANMFRHKMLIDQALGGDTLDEPKRTVERIKRKLKNAGFDIEIEYTETPEKLLRKSLKKQGNK